MTAISMVSELLSQAGFSDEEVAVKLYAHTTGKRPVTSLTKRMEAVRDACGPAITDKFAEIDGPVALTEMSVGNNFDITYGEKRIRIVTERGGLVTIIDGGNLEFVESDWNEVEPDVAAKRIVVFMIGGSEALEDERREAEEDEQREAEEEEVLETFKTTRIMTEHEAHLVP